MRAVRLHRYGITLLFGLFLASLIRGVMVESDDGWRKMPLYQPGCLGCEFQVCCDEDFHYARCSTDRDSCCADGCGQHTADCLDHTLCCTTNFCKAARGCECVQPEKEPSFSSA